MSLQDILHNKKVLSIDPSTKSIAFAVISKTNQNTTIEAKGKINLSGCDDINAKIKCINAVLPILVSKHKPTHCVIEQTIYIQNPQTTRLLAYVVGAMLSISLSNHLKTSDVGPLDWKRWLGYKNVSKTQIAEWSKELGEKEAKKKASFERKNRVKVILQERIPSLEEDDYDIIDAIAIGYWAVNNL